MTEEKLYGVLFLLLSIMSLLCPIAQTNQLGISNNFINTCNKFEEKLRPICIKVINSDSREDLKSDIRGLFAIFINHSIVNGTDNYLYLLEQLKRSDLDNKIRVVFNECVEGYEIGMAILKSSLVELLKNHNRDKELSDSMTNAFDDIVSCEFDFEDFIPEPPTWLARSLTLRPLLELSMGFANLLECGQVPGHRAYVGHRKYIKPNKRAMLEYFDDASISETELGRIMRNVHKRSQEQPKARTKRKDRDVVAYPVPECMCKANTASVII